MTKVRCDWCLKDDIYIKYHDEVWGIPEYDDQNLFEYINLEGAQAGLSWYTILIRIEEYRKAFADWDVKKISKFNQRKVESLLKNEGIIRNRLKVNAVITNAKAYLELKKTISFSDYLWNFVDGEPIINNVKSMKQVQASTDLSKEISKDLKKKGFKFVGPTIVYAFMQAVGMVDDHLNSCWKKN